MLLLPSVGPLTSQSKPLVPVSKSTPSARTTQSSRKLSFRKEAHLSLGIQWTCSARHSLQRWTSTNSCRRSMRSRASGSTIILLQTPTPSQAPCSMTMVTSSSSFVATERRARERRIRRAQLSAGAVLQFLAVSAVRVHLSGSDLRVQERGPRVPLVRHRGLALLH